MKKFFPYPETKHFKEATSNLFKTCQFKGEKVNCNLHGTIKLHGTNFAVIYDVKEDSIYTQKRSGLLDKQQHFFGWQNVIYPCEKELKQLGKEISDNLVDHVIFYGELIGEEIQKGVALSQLSKKFVIFDIVTVHYSDNSGNNEWLFNDHNYIKIFFNKLFINKNINDLIYSIENFQTWDLPLNIHNRSEMMETQNKMSEITLQVEKECPFAKEFGISGIGEGVVWRDLENNFKCKVKGAEHSTSKVKTLTGVSQDKIDDLKGVEDIANAICTEARFKQGMQNLIENPPENIHLKKSIFVRWVVEDTLKEEIDVIIEKKADLHKVKAQLYKNAVNWWLINNGDKI